MVSANIINELNKRIDENLKNNSSNLDQKHQQLKTTNEELMKVKLESNQIKDEFENLKLQLKFKIEELNQKNEENKLLIKSSEDNKMH